MTLYKYSKFSVYTLESMRSGKVYFASREELNDPFDCSPQILIDLPSIQLDELLLQLGARENSLLKLSFEEKKSLIEISQVPLLKSSGVYCVSSDPTNELMWAHYGDNHRGLILGWGKPDNTSATDELSSVIKNIDYNGRGQLLASDLLTISRPRENGGGLLRPTSFRDAVHRATAAMFLCKNPAWEYEAENRWLRVGESGLYDLHANLVSVTFGLRFPLGMRPLVTALLSESVRTYETRISETKLVRVEIG